MITFVAGGFSSSSDSLARRLEKSLKINLKDSTSPVLIEDMALNHYSNNIFARVTVVLLLMENADGSPCTVLAE